MKKQRGIIAIVLGLVVVLAAVAFFLLRGGLGAGTDRGATASRATVTSSQHQKTRPKQRRARAAASSQAHTHRAKVTLPKIIYVTATAQALDFIQQAKQAGYAVRTVSLPSPTVAGGTSYGYPLYHAHFATGKSSNTAALNAYLKLMATSATVYMLGTDWNKTDTTHGGPLAYDQKLAYTYSGEGAIAQPAYITYYWQDQDGKMQSNGVAHYGDVDMFLKNETILAHGQCGDAVTADGANVASAIFRMPVLSGSYGQGQAVPLAVTFYQGKQLTLKQLALDPQAVQTYCQKLFSLAKGAGPDHFNQDLLAKRDLAQDTDLFSSQGHWYLALTDAPDVHDGQATAESYRLTMRLPDQLIKPRFLSLIRS